MGDVGTHAEITAFTTEQARGDIADSDIPEADYTYMELGNFLTDLSQFRDPVAFHAARERAMQTVVSEHGSAATWFGYARAWANAIFGTHTGRVHGDLAEFLADLMRGGVHLIFDDDGLPSLGSALGLHGGGRRPHLLMAHGIPPAEVSTLLGRHFTQYFPHEHLDFPPTHRPMDSHRTDAIFQRGGRGLIGYLEWMTQYLSEELSILEEEWTRARAGRLSDAQRHDLLVRLGHLMHPVEDYFFHSNLLEITQWNLVRARYPSADPAVPDGLQQLVRAGLTGTALSPPSARQLRVLHRRLRYPVWDSRGLSTTQSEDGTDIVFTGGFGQTDVWHTLGGVLEGMESQIARLPSSHDPRRTHLVLFRLMLSRSEREDMVRRNTSAALMETHRRQLRAGEYAAQIADWETRRLICPHTAARFRDAFTRDLRVAVQHSGVKYDFPGPGGVLITMLNLMQTERTASAAARRRLDGRWASMYEVGTDNGCGEEVVGTHSLMSKDSTDKEPMRPEAVALAKHASASLATTLLRRVHSATPITEGVDWDTVLRFYLRGPGRRGGTWEDELVTGLRNSGTFRQPDVSTPSDQPRYGLLGPTRGPDKLAARRRGGTKAALEAYYRGFETDP